jgi:heme A synthase
MKGLNMENISTQESIESLLTPKVQLQRGALALVCCAYAAFSFITNDFYLPSKHGKGMHFQGASASLLELMLIFSALACLLPLGMVYDKRSEHPDYEKLRRYCAFTAYGLLGLGLTLNLFHPFSSPDVSASSLFLRLVGWLGAGVLCAQFGRFPPSYLGKKTNTGNPNVPKGVAYFAAFLVGIISACLLFLTWVIFSRRPDILFSPIVLFPVVTLILGIGFAYYAYSIVQRSR